MTPAHAQALEALRETRDVLAKVFAEAAHNWYDPVGGVIDDESLNARAALAHADYVLALQAKEHAK